MFISKLVSLFLISNNQYHYYLSLNVSYQDIGSQLQTAAEVFLEADDGCVVDSVKKEVKLSQIFKWYKADFGDTDEKVA